MKRTVLFAVIVSLVVFLVGCGGGAGYAPGTAIQMKSVDGKDFTIGIEREKPVFLVFFATWCPGCEMMIPDFDSVAKTLDRSKIDVLLVGREHTAEELKEWSDTLDLSCDLIPDPERDIYSRFADKQIPRLYVLDKKGGILFETTGWSPSKMAPLQMALEEVQN